MVNLLDDLATTCERLGLITFLLRSAPKDPAVGASRSHAAATACVNGQNCHGGRDRADRGRSGCWVMRPGRAGLP